MRMYDIIERKRNGGVLTDDLTETCVELAANMLLLVELDDLETCRSAVRVRHPR